MWAQEAFCPAKVPKVTKWSPTSDISLHCQVHVDKTGYGKKENDQLGDIVRTNINMRGKLTCWFWDRNSKWSV